jgi:creatinine amidohydrolase
MYQTLKDFKEHPKELAILPVGALEQHGSHLPVGTDNIIASAFAKRIAEALDAYLLPCMGITSSIEHREAEGTVYLKADTLAAIIRDVAESLHYSGYKRLILINGHGGNWILKPTIRQINRDIAPFEVVLIHTGAALHRQHEVMDHVKNDIHAGEKETSIILYLCEEYVKKIKEPVKREFFPQDFMDYFDNMELTEDGYWGFPENATKEKGKKMMDLLVECALDYLQKLDTLKKNLGK